MSETRSCKIQTWQILLAWAPSLPLPLGQAGDAPSGAHPFPWAMAAPFPAQQLLGYQGMSFTCVFGFLTLCSFSAAPCKGGFHAVPSFSHIQGKTSLGIRRQELVSLVCTQQSQGEGSFLLLQHHYFNNLILTDEN